MGSCEGKDLRGLFVALEVKADSSLRVRMLERGHIETKGRCKRMTKLGDGTGQGLKGRKLGSAGAGEACRLLADGDIDVGKPCSADDILDIFGRGFGHLK